MDVWTFFSGDACLLGRQRELYNKSLEMTFLPLSFPFFSKSFSFETNVPHQSTFFFSKFVFSFTISSDISWKEFDEAKYDFVLVSFSPPE